MNSNEEISLDQERDVVTRKAHALGLPRVVWQTGDRFRVVQVLDEPNAEIIFVPEKADGYDLLGEPRWTQIIFPYDAQANPLFGTCEHWKDLAYELMKDFLGGLKR